MASMRRWRALRMIAEPSEYIAFGVLGLVAIPLGNGYGSGPWAAYVRAHGPETAALHVMGSAGVMYLVMSVFFCAVDFLRLAERYKTQPKVQSDCYCDCW